MRGLSPTWGLGVACHRLRSFSRVCCRRCAGHSPSLLKCGVCRSFVRLGVVFCRASASGAVGRRWDSGGCRESFCDARGVEFEAATVFDFGVAAYGADGRCRCVALVSGNLSRGRECRWQVRGYTRRQGQRSRSQPPQTDIQTDIHLSIQTDGQTYRQPYRHADGHTYRQAACDEWVICDEGANCDEWVPCDERMTYGT